MISLDKKYQTKDGRNVRLLCVDGPGSYHGRAYPVVGYIEGERNPDTWTADGVWHPSGYYKEKNLVEVRKKYVRYVPVWAMNVGHKLYFNKETAKKFGKLDATPDSPFLGVAEVTIEEPDAS